jgi:FtsZ-interacting cell division protein ZipA
MYPKTALKILLGVIVILAIIFGGFYVKNRFFDKEARDARQIEDIIDKKKQQQDLTEEEQQKLKIFVDQKVEEKRDELEQKTEEEIKTEGYTQGEVNFILDPERTVETELGIGEKPENSPMTQEEIDAILNPIK